MKTGYTFREEMEKLSWRREPYAKAKKRSDLLIIKKRFNAITVEMYISDALFSDFAVLHARKRSILNLSNVRFILTL